MNYSITNYFQKRQESNHRVCTSVTNVGLNLIPIESVHSRRHVSLLFRANHMEIANLTILKYCSICYCLNISVTRKMRSRDISLISHVTQFKYISINGLFSETAARSRKSDRVVCTSITNTLNNKPNRIYSFSALCFSSVTDLALFV